jgi:hypothetical protein
VAIACSNPPKGHSRWTLDLLAGAMVQLTETEHEGLSRETVRRRLAKDDLKPWRSLYVRFYQDTVDNIRHWLDAQDGRGCRL